MKKVLFIVNSFPPPINGGNIRVYKFSKYLLRHGWDVFIVCNASCKEKEVLSDELLSKELEGIKIYSVSSITQYISKSTNNINETNEPLTITSRLRQLILKRLKDFYLFLDKVVVPDMLKYTWNPVAFKIAKKIIKDNNISNVITSSPPHSTQLIGLKLRNYFGDEINWICDYRDLWSLSHIFDMKMSFRKKANFYLERNINQKVDHLLVVSESIKIETEISSLNPIETQPKVITNGFDDEDFQNICYSFEPSNNFIISYIGTIMGPITHNRLIDGIKLFLKGTKKQSIKFRFVGNFDPKWFNQINESESIEIFPFVNHQEAIQLMYNSNILILILTNDKEGTMAFTGKFFEYLRIGKPMLVLAPEGEVSSIVRRYNLGIVANPENPEEIASAINFMYQNLKGDGIYFDSPPMDLLAKFSRESLTRDLENILRY